MTDLRIRTEEKYTKLVHTEERMMSKRATFHVYFKKTEASKKGEFVPTYAKTAEAAAKQVKEIYRRAVICWVVPVDGTVAVPKATDADFDVVYKNF